MRDRTRTWLAAIALLVLASPAAAQWVRVPDVPATDVFTLSTKGDTIVAGLAAVVYLSTNGGLTWKKSAIVSPGVSRIRAAIIHDGRLYAGTFGQGVFVSNDLGTTWSTFSQGLSGPGALIISGLVVFGDDLYAATVGSAAWVRNLDSGTWTPFGSQTIAAFQASNMDGGITVGGSRLFAMGGANGIVFFRDPGQTDWTASLLFNDRLAPGLSALSALWTGTSWVVGSNIGMFRSPTGQPPWTFFDMGLHSLFFTSVAMHGADVYSSLGAFGGTLIVVSHDDGASWQGLDTLVSVGVYSLAVHGDDLLAGRVDGLWRHAVGPGAVSVPGEITATQLRFAVAGPQPIGDEARFRFELPAPASVVLEFFDITGRQASEPVREFRPAGTQEIRVDARGLAPGIYLARLTAAGSRAVARVVRAR